MRRVFLRTASALVMLLIAAAPALACGRGDAAPAERQAPPAPPAVATERGSAHSFDLRRVAHGLSRPVWAGAAPGDAGALWFAEQPGRLVRRDGGRRTVALDLTRKVKTGAEQGLLGLAFHPDFASNRLLYVHYSDRRGDTRVDELRADRRGTRIGARPVRTLLQLDQPEENHNGGHLAFGPDGRLYLGLGDGGGAFDPRETAQSPDTLLGKLLATDVAAREPRWSVVLTGLRNPWRFAFDPALGEVWIGDVGQDRVEEINRVLLEPDEPPKNLGWSVYEGVTRIGGDRRLGAGELVWPAATYGHDVGCSVTGGLVYAGVAVPALAQRYVYGDFCTGALWSLRAAPGSGATDVRRERAKVPQLTHIGTDGDGELLLVSATGAVYRAVGAGS
jgi:glucose/arabinose dehydrogenase